MAMQATCGMCGRTIEARTEDELVQRMQHHASEQHDKEMTEQETREMVRSQQKS